MQLHGHTPHHKPLHLQANKSSTTTSTCTIVVGTWKAPCTKLWFLRLVKIVKQLSGTIKALWHKSPALWSMGFVPSGTNPIQLETQGTTKTLLSTPFNAHPNPRSPQTNPTIHNTQVHTTIPKQWIGNYGVCGWKDRCRDGNLRTYCHVSPILFGWFFVEASPTCFCIFVKCFFCNLATIMMSFGYVRLSVIIRLDCTYWVDCITISFSITELYSWDFYHPIQT